MNEEARQAQRDLGLSDEELLVAHIERMSGGFVALRGFGRDGRTYVQVVWFKRCRVPQLHYRVYQTVGVSGAAALVALCDLLAERGFLPTQAA